MPDDWQGYENGLFKRVATFAQRSSMRPGDGIVFYATGTGAIFAAGQVTSYPYEHPGDDPWRWRVDVAISHGAPFIHSGVPLERLNVGTRNLLVVIKRRSHVRLTPDEFDAALKLLPRL